MKGKLIKWSRTVALAACALFSATAARAEYVCAETPAFDGLKSLVTSSATPHGYINISVGEVATQAVQGTSLLVYRLYGGGQLSVNVSDLNFPAALPKLEYLITDLNGLYQRHLGAGESLIDLGSDARHFFVAIFARSESLDLPGLYSFDVSTVPLPAAFWLLLSGVGGLSFFRRRRSASASTPATAS